MSEELKPITAADAGFDAEEPNAMGILLFTSVTVVLLIAVVIGVTYYFNNVYERREYEQVLAPPSEQLKELHAREDWELTHYQYVDKTTGQIRIPLNRAMELLVKEASEGKLKYPTVDQPVKKIEPVVAQAVVAQ
jgi:hypothetical protein